MGRSYRIEIEPEGETLKGWRKEYKASWKDVENCSTWRPMNVLKILSKNANEKIVDYWRIYENNDNKKKLYSEFTRIIKHHATPSDKSNINQNMRTYKRAISLEVFKTIISILETDNYDPDRSYHKTYQKKERRQERATARSDKYNFTFVNPEAETLDNWEDALEDTAYVASEASLPCQEVHVEPESLLAFDINHIIQIPTLMTSSTSKAVEITRTFNGLLLCLGGCLYNTDLTQRIIHISQFLNGHVSPSLIQKAATVLASLFRPPGIEPQAEIKEIKDTNQQSETLMTCMYQLLSGCLGNKTPKQVTFDIQRVNRISSLLTGANSVKGLGNLLSKAMSETWIYACAAYTQRSVGEIELENKIETFYTWHQEVGEIFKNDGLLMCSRDIDTARRVKSLYQNGLEMEKCIISAKISRDAVLVFRESMRRLDQMLKTTVAFSGTERTRTPPLTIHFWGGTGVGKSSLVKYFLKDLYEIQNKPLTHKHDVYTRNFAQEYWDGYRNQKVVIFDDFLQSRNKEVLATIYQDLINMVNVMPYNLKMANLEEKGNTQFSSELVVLTSNVNFAVGDTPIQTPAAVYRRRNLIYKVCIKKEFQNSYGGLDETLVKTSLETQGKLTIGNETIIIPFARYVFEFVPCEVVTNGGPGRERREHGVLNWNQMIDTAILEWDRINEKSRIERIYCGLDDDLPALQQLQSISAPKQTSAYHIFRRALQWICGQDTSEGDNTLVLPLRSKWRGKLLDCLDLLGLSNENPFTKGLRKIAAKREMWSNDLTLSSITPIVGTLIATLATLSFIFKCGSKSSKSSNWQVMPNGIGVESGDVKTSRSKPRKMISSRKGFRGAIANTTNPEAGVNTNLLSFVDRIMKESAVKIRIQTDDGDSISSYGLMIQDRLLLAPAHVLYYGDLAASILVYDYEGTFVIAANRETCRNVMMDDKDMGLIELPIKTKRYRNICKYLVDDEFALPSSSNCVLAKLSPNSCNNISFHYPAKITSCSGIIIQKKANPRLGVSTVGHGVRYGIATSPGDCGSILCDLTGASGCRLISMHVGGSGGEGYGTILSRIDIQDMLDSLQDEVPWSVDNISIYPECEETIKESENLIFQGILPPEYRIYIPNKTTLVPSVFSGELSKSLTKPAALRRVGDKDPMLLGLLKGDKNMPLIDIDQLIEAKYDLVNDLNSYACSMSPKIFSVSEAINGHSEDGLPSMNMQTSPGFPYVKMQKGGGKLNWFVGEVGSFEPNSILQSNIQKHYDNFKELKRKPIIYYDVLKDERRPLAKVEACSTRIFSVGPLDMSILIRQYFSAFELFLQRNHVYGEVSVGLNVHSMEWQDMYYHLALHGPSTCLTGDYSAYDKTIPKQLMYAVLDIINTWYGDAHMEFREYLFMLVCERYHVVSDVVYKPNHGNPSGNPLTATINSLVNALIMRLAFYGIYDSEKVKFSACVVAKFYGDDFICTVSDCTPAFNMSSIKELIESLGMKFQCTDKMETEDTREYISLQEATYLKRKFVFSDRFMQAPLPLENVLEIMSWRRTTSDDTFVMSDIFDSVQIELSHHGKEIYKEYVGKIMSIFKRYPSMKYNIKGYMQIMKARYEGKICIEPDNFAESIIKPSGKRSDWREMSHIACVTHNQGVGESQARPIFVSPQGCTTSPVHASQKLVSKNSINQVESGGSIMEGNQSMQASNEVTSATSNSRGDALVGHVSLDDGNMKQQDITSFQDVVVSEPMMDHTTSLVPDVYPMDTIATWLTRAHPIKTFEWSETDVGQTLLTSVDLPNDLFALKTIWDKVSNFRYIRAGIRLELRINGTKAHYGTLMVNTVPFPDAVPVYWMSFLHATGYPFTLFSPTENEVTTIDYSFQHTDLYHEIPDSDKNTWMSAYIWVVNPLRTASAASGSVPPVSCTLYASFYDVQLQGYTATLYNIPDPSVPREVSLTSYIEPQAGGGEKESIKKSSKGLISDTLRTVGVTCGSLAVIPQLSAFMSPLSLAFDSASRVARALGYSKPDTKEAVQPVIPKYLSLGTARGLDTSVKLAVSPDNALSSAVNHLGTLGEMEIERICNTPMFSQTMVWSETQPYRELVGDVELTPSGGQLNYFMYLSNLFQHVRTDTRLFVQVVSSAFHAGRIRISYDPRSNALATEDMVNRISRVLDIGTTTTCHILIPFLKTTPYIRTDMKLGTVSIHVENPLTGAFSPVTDVEINIFISYCNVDFAGPVDSQLRIMTPEDVFLDRKAPKKIIKSRKRKEKQNDTFVNIEPQGITRNEIQAAQYEPIIKANSLRIEGLVQGERVVHVKDLTSRPTMMTKEIVSSDSVNTMGTVQIVSNGDPFNTLPAAPYKMRLIRESVYVYIFLDDENIVKEEPLILCPGTYRFDGTFGYDGSSFSVDYFYKMDGDDFEYPLYHLSYRGSEDTNVARQISFTCNISKAISIGVRKPTGIVPEYFTTSINVTPIQELGYDCRIAFSRTLLKVGTYSTFTGRTDYPSTLIFAAPTDDTSMKLEVVTPTAAIMGGTQGSGGINYNFIPILFDNSFFNRIAVMYRFYRGSVRHKFVEVGDAPSNAMVVRSKAIGFGTGGGAIAVRDPVSNSMEVTLPFYHDTFAIQTLNRDHMPGGSSILRFGDSNVFGNTYIPLLSSGDDGEFLYLSPPPPLVTRFP